MRILLCHFATQICHSTMQGMALCLSVRLCAFVCVCVFAAFLEIPVTSEAGARYYLMSFYLQWKSPWILKGPIHTQTAENILWKIWGENEKNFWYGRGSEAIHKNNTHLTPFLPWLELLSCLFYTQATRHRVSVCLGCTEQTECDRGIF